MGPTVCITSEGEERERELGGNIQHAVNTFPIVSSQEPIPSCLCCLSNDTSSQIRLTLSMHEGHGLHVAGSLYPAEIFASPAEHPPRVAHSSLSMSPAAEWMAPSTGGGQEEAASSYIFYTVSNNSRHITLID